MVRLHHSSGQARFRQDFVFATVRPMQRRPLKMNVYITHHKNRPGDKDLAWLLCIMGSYFSYMPTANGILVIESLPSHCHQPSIGHLYGRFSEDVNELLGSCRSAEAEYRAAAVGAPESDPAALDRWPLMAHAPPPHTPTLPSPRTYPTGQVAPDAPPDSRSRVLSTAAQLELGSRGNRCEARQGGNIMSG